MDNHQLEGRLLLDPGTDIIFLVHEVHGRTSEMKLSKEDHIVVLDREEKKPVKVDDLFDIPEPGSKRRRFIEDAAYHYQGARVIVTLSTKGTIILNNSYVKWYVRHVMDYVKSKDITWEEAEVLIDKVDEIGSSLE